jgi:hypothetical protein
MKKANKELRKAVKSLSLYLDKNQIRKGIIDFFGTFSPYLVQLGVGTTYDFMDQRFRRSFEEEAIGWDFFFKGFPIKDVYNELANAYYHAEAYFSGLLLKDEVGILGKNWTFVFELNLYGHTVADFAAFPKEEGKCSIGIEIKTDLDSLNRLDHQLTDYYRIFDTVWVLTTESKAKKVLEIIEKNAVDHPTCNHQKAGVLILKGKKLESFASGSCEIGKEWLEKDKDEHWNALFDLLTKKDLMKLVPKEIDARKWNFRTLCLAWVKSHLTIGEFRSSVYSTVAAKYEHQSNLAIAEAKNGYYIFCQPAFKTGWDRYDEKYKRLTSSEMANREAQL